MSFKGLTSIENSILLSLHGFMQLPCLCSKRGGPFSFFIVGGDSPSYVIFCKEESLNETWDPQLFR